MNTPHMLLREYVSGDEDRIIKLHREVFNSDASLKRWKWQFLKHPMGRGWITLLEANSEIVGQYCMMHNHLNYLGSEIVVGQACDGMVRSDHTGKGWLVKLARRNFEYAAEKGVKAVFGFPNRNSYPIHMKYLDWFRLFNLSHYQYRIGFSKIVGTKADYFFKSFHALKKRSEYLIYSKTRIKKFNISTINVLPQNIDTILREINTYEVLSIWKDKIYLKWRYEDHPTNKYLFHILEIDDSVEGLIITRNCGDTIAICEVLSRTKNESQIILLLLYIVNFFIKMRPQKIVFLGYDNGFFDSVFHQAGFKKSISNLIFCGRVFEEGKLRDLFRSPNNWSISYGDSDVI